MVKLSAKQQAFVTHYLTCWNASEAARRAGYSDKSAYSIGWENLRKPEIQAAINERVAETHASADEVLARLTSHSRATMADFISVAGQHLDLEKAEERGVLHLIKKFRVRTVTVSKPEGEDVETHTVEIELHDSQAATVQLAKILGLYVERVEVRNLNDKADNELISEFQSIVDAARTRSAGSDSGGTATTHGE